MQGLGNDFIIVEADSWEKAAAFQVYAEKLCNRFFGIGGDGLVITGIDIDRDADIFMRIFNSDGSEAMMCGNGIRCVARYAFEKGLIDSARLAVRTMSGIKHPVLELESGRVSQVRVDMGEPVLESRQIPMDTDASNIGLKIDTSQGMIEATAVSMGNPHCVLLVDSINESQVVSLGPEIEHHRLFPQRTNVEFIQVLNEGEIIMRVWERGCGVTLACGTGACASAVAAFLNGQTGRRVMVHLLGGDLLIEWNQDSNHVFMTGPAETVFAGRIDLTL